jgi:hypothetical protein
MSEVVIMGASGALSGKPDMVSPAHWCRHDLNIRLSPELAGFAVQVASAWPGPQRQRLRPFDIWPI